MLTEFAFTPSIFDEDVHTDKEAWRDQIRELTSALFPRTSAWPVVVADLHAGAWSSHIVPYVKKIKDHRARAACQDLLTAMSKILVVRPECCEWPGEDDIKWCREAVASNKVEPIERIVSVRPTKESFAEEFRLVRSINELEDSGFWKGIDSDASPKMVITEQVKMLRKICLHSEWAALINCYGFGNEQDFTLQLLKLAFSRNPDFGPIHFELHAQAPDAIDPVKQEKKQKNVTSNMICRIHKEAPEANSVDLLFWPKILDRMLLAGSYAKDSNGTKRKKIRWGVSMNHVAHGDDPDAARTEWKLLQRKQLGYWFGKYVSEDITNKPVPIPIYSKQKQIKT